MTLSDKNNSSQTKKPYRSRYQNSDEAYQSPFSDLMRFLKTHGMMIIRIVGSIGVVAGVYFLIGGIVCMAQNSMVRNADGNYPTWALHMDRDSHAVVFKPDGSWILGGDMGYIEIDVTPVNGKDVFVGIAHTELVRDYLESMSYDEITGLSIFPDNAGFTTVPGGTPLTAPADQFYWEQSLAGKDTQTLGWATSRNVTVVIMNADGSAGVDFEVVIWTSEAYRFTAGVSNLSIGGFLLLLSLFAVLYTRKPRSTVYPMPLEAVIEAKMKRKEKLRKWQFWK